MEGLRIIALSDLLSLSRPLTGAASLHSPNPSSPPAPTEPPPKTLPFSPNLNNPNPRFFTSLNYPVLLIGTVDLLPSDDPQQCTNCKDHCLSFTEGPSRVCCSFLDLHDLSIIGREIHVLAWNFLPFDRKKGGNLEVIRWNFSSPDLPSKSPFRGDHLVPGSHAIGKLKSVSPIFSVPCKNPTSTGFSIGFLTEIITCQCDLCSSSSQRAVDVNSPIWRQSCHSFTNSVFVYFLKPTVVWRPLVAKLVGKLIVISGLKKKLIFVGEETSYLMSMTEEKTKLSLCQLPMEVMAVSKGKDDERIYNGIVTGVYMQGMVVELDEKVWLLITDSRIAPSHSLRVGAIVSVRNFHMVCPKYSWTRMLLLETGVRTSIYVKSFSPSDTRCYARTQSQSLLGNFIDSLTLTAKFWVILLISCFRKKFAGILSDKEVLGSRNKEGLAQLYASTSLHSSFFCRQHGVFMEFCKHDQSSCSNESNVTPLKLVIPISNLISHCEAIWVSITSKFRSDVEKVERNDFVNTCGEGISRCRVMRRILSSKDLGFILMGTLKISSSSGRLQLVDATGSIDALIPDLLSNFNDHSIYEIKDYNLVLEGLPMQLDYLEFHNREALSCRSFFQQFPLKKVLKDLVPYIHFYLGDSTCLSVPFRLPSCKERSDVFDGITGDMTHLLLVTHKFPATKNFLDDPAVPGISSLFAEALVIPYNLIILEEHAHNQNVEVSLDKLHEETDFVESRGTAEKGWFKRRKVVQVPSRITVPGSKNGLNKFKSHSKIPCLCTFRSTNHQGSPVAGYLCATDRTAWEEGADNSCFQRILLEFQSESFWKYQLLQLGRYYILKGSRIGLTCNVVGNENMNCGKILISSQTTVRSLSFTFDKVIHQKEPSVDHASGVFSVRACETYSGKLMFRHSVSQIHGTSDIHVLLSSEATTTFSGATEASKNGLTKFLPSPGDVLSVSACIQIMNDEIARPFGAAESADLPQGRIISLHGNIEDVQMYNRKSNSYVSYEYTNISQRRAFSIVIHISDDHHKVQLRGNISAYSYPIGMGPGVNATFHRVLMTCTSSGCSKLVLTPVSFVEINSINEAGQWHCEERSAPLSRLSILNQQSFDMVSLGFISQLVRCGESKLIRIHGRVVSVHILILEKHTLDLGKSQANGLSKFPAVNIPLAGFLLDDGSSLCCCWASDDRAETFLRLHETSQRLFFSGHRISKSSRSKSCQDTVGFHLEKMLKKHRRVTTKNHKAGPDSSSLGFTFLVSSDEIFGHSEERLLRLIILNACLGSTFNIVGNMMDPNAFELLNTEFEELHVTMQPIRHVWITGIEYVNTLKEARGMLQELLTS